MGFPLFLFEFFNVFNLFKTGYPKIKYLESLVRLENTKIFLKVFNLYTVELLIFNTYLTLEYLVENNR